MSRRMRRPEIVGGVRQVLAIVQRGAAPSAMLLIDGKALEVSDYSRDPDAKRGYGVEIVASVDDIPFKDNRANPLCTVHENDRL